MLTQFVLDYTRYVLKGSTKFYAWMGTLALLIAGMLYVYFLQNTEGLIVTGLTSQIHDGLYLANLVFLVGVAAGAVTIVFPAYVYHHEGMHKVTVLGEMLAISAVIMVMMFVFAHMGRPDRLWHMIPPFGIYSFSSMLGWDVLVLNGYLFLNAIVGFWYLYSKYTGKPVNKKIFLPLVYVSIVWALSIHTVTAFLLATNPSRPMWFHSMMPIRFIATAFAAGPALIIIAFLVIRKNTKFWIDDSAIQLLTSIVTWCLGIAIFLTLSEVVIELVRPHRTRQRPVLPDVRPARPDRAGGLVLGRGGADAGVLRAVPDAVGAQRHEQAALRLRHGLRGHLDRKGHGPGGARLHPLAHWRGDRVLPHLCRMADDPGHLGLRLLHPDHPAQGRHRHPVGRYQVRRPHRRHGEVR